MSFFERARSLSPPEPEPPQPPRPPWMQPESVLPGVVPVQLVLARTDVVAVAVVGLFAYPNGFEFILTTVSRVEPSGRWAAFDPMSRYGRRVDADELPDDFLRFGLEFSDGGVVSNLGMPWPAGDEEPAGPLLVSGGGGGGMRRWDMRQWVWPLPPAGPVIFVCEWPEYGIAETRAEVDGGLIRAAAGQSVELWPEPFPRSWKL